VQGSSTLLIEVRSKVATNATPFDIRFAEWRRFGWRSVSPEMMRIRHASIPQWDDEAKVERDFTGLNIPHTDFNSVGGVGVRTRLPKHLAVGERLMIELDVQANGTWRGCLSFRARAYGRRAFCRRRVEVIGDLPK
jgi:hypothetical protein